MKKTKTISISIFKLVLPLFVLLFFQIAANAQYTQNEQACFNMVKDKVAWNKSGNKSWGEDNIRALCKGTTNPAQTINCFSSNIATDVDWQTAIQACASVKTNPVANAQTLNLNGDWEGYYNASSKSPYVWRIVQMGASLAFEDVGAGSGTKFSGKLNNRLITDSNGQVGKLSDNNQQIVWRDGVIWKKKGNNVTTTNWNDKTEILVAPAGTRKIRLRNNGAFNVRLSATYYTIEGGNEIGKTVALDSSILLGGDQVLEVPYGTSDKPVEIKVEDPNKKLLPIKVPANFSGEICYKTFGAIWNPTLSTCDDVITDFPGTEYRQIQFKNRAGYDAKMTVTYTVQESSGANVRDVKKTLDTGFVNLNRDIKINIPKETTQLLGIEVKFERYGASPSEIYSTTLPYDFSDTPCFMTKGNVWQPTASYCDGTIGEKYNPSRTIIFKNEAGYDAQMSVTYFEKPANGGTPVSKTVKSGFITFSNTSKINIPKTTLAGNSIKVELKGSGTYKDGIYFANLPADFSEACFKTWGTLFSPQGGACDATNTVATPQRTLTFFNQSGYVAKMIIEYNETDSAGNYTWKSQDTGFIAVGASTSLTIPDNVAGLIQVKVRGTGTFNNNFYNTTVQAETFTGDRCFKAWGTIFSPQGGGC